MRRNGDETFERSSLELLRRALAHGDQEAWAGFQQCLEETVLTWLHGHPSREAACRRLCEKDVVAQAFELFRQGAVQGQSGLGPQEIVQCCPQEWSDVQEISRLRCHIVKRLFHHAESILLLTQSSRG